MQPQKNFRAVNCSECLRGVDLGFDFTMAFQPIVNAADRSMYAHESLVRGPENESAGWVFERVNEENRYFFDQSCRVKAVNLAARLGMEARLSINFMPNAVYRPEQCIRTTLAAAEEFGFPVNRIILEVTESEEVTDKAHVVEIIQHYKERGFTTAIDDFGAGHSGLNLLAEFQPHLVKLDMALIRNIDTDTVRQIIVKGIVGVCRGLNMEPIAEGIETRDEYRTLLAMGIELFQGYYFARPQFEGLAEIPAQRFE